MHFLLALMISAGPPSLSPAASATLTARWPGAKIKAVEVEKNGDFEVELEGSSGAFEVTLSPTGAVVAEERVIALEAAPPEVRKTIASWRDMKVTRVERVTVNSVDTFEVVVVPLRGPTVEVVLSAAGHELSRGRATE